MLLPNKSDRRFTVDWAPQVRSTWPSFVAPRLIRNLPLQWLEIGSFEGRSALWTIENLFDNPKSRITCVDCWEPIPFHKQWSDLQIARHGDTSDFDYEKIFDHNVRGVAQVIKRKGRSHEILPTLASQHFHGCYIDGSHDEIDVLSDARMVLPMMTPGAVIIFDDYRWSGGDGVKKAVDTLLLEWGSKVTKVHMEYQVILQVTAAPT
jgi:predicted O-methyltransferase YrrM